MGEELILSFVSAVKKELPHYKGDVKMFHCLSYQNPDFEFIRNHHVVGKTTMYDLTVDPTEKYVATACQDRNIRYAMTEQDVMKSYKGGNHHSFFQAPCL